MLLLHFFNTLVRLFCSRLEALHHNEHKQRREQAQYNEYRPNKCEAETTPKESTNGYEEVTDCGSYEPATHHKALVLWRCYLGYE